MPPIRAPTGDRVHNLGVCPDWAGRMLQPAEQLGHRVPLGLE